MNKTWLIIKREYTSRVRNKTFIISTFLMPLLFVGLIVTIAYLSVKSPGLGNSGAAAPPAPRNDGTVGGLAYLIGYFSSILIYFSILVYGSMVMRGVSEEKTNRIAEIIISSVRPFQLMMGKILGIGAVGLTQFLMWLVLIVLFSAGASAFMPLDTFHQAGAASQSAVSLPDMGQFNLPLIAFCFIYYFVFGYLFYASMFAAVGSAVNEDAHDLQAFMWPMTMPIVLAIIFMMQAVSDPSGKLAFWTSVIPFFSPVVMMARIPFGVPWWELALSMFLLGGGFILSTWVGAKIYRTGILLYGKKITWKEMWKWATKA